MLLTKGQEGRRFYTGLRKGDIGEYILLPGDPERCNILQSYVDDAQLVHYQREHKTYTGTYKGVRVSIVSTGMGCASASIVAEELISLGAKVLIRVGGSAALHKEVNPGDFLISIGAMKNTAAAARYVPDEYPAIPDRHLTSLILECAKEMCKGTQRKAWLGINASNDGYYTETPEFIEKMVQLGIQNMEMESAGIFTVAHVHGARAACICGAGANLQTGVRAKLVDGKNMVQSQAHQMEIKVALDAIIKLHNENGGR